MEVNTIILLSEGMEAISVAEIASKLDAADKVLHKLGEHITTVTLIAPPEQLGLDALTMPVVFPDVDNPGFLYSLCKALAPLPCRHTLILSVDDLGLSADHIGQLLDYSERLPHMSVVSSRDGNLVLPVLLPLDSYQSIQDYLNSQGQATLMKWLEQSVFVECERLDS